MKFKPGDKIKRVEDYSCNYTYGKIYVAHEDKDGELCVFDDKGDETYVRDGYWELAEGADMVNEPPHYKAKSGLQAIDVIEQFELGYHLGNAVKYILRAGKKDDAKQDIEKAIWYLGRYNDRQD